jgi:hypothetical protein
MSSKKLMVKVSGKKPLSTVRRSKSARAESGEENKNINKNEWHHPVPDLLLSVLLRSDSKSESKPDEILPFPPVKFLPKPDKNLLSAMSSIVGTDKIYRFKLASVVTVSSSGAGLVNAVINVVNVLSSAEFSAFSGIFQEFFVKRMDIVFMPASRYQYPTTGTSALSVANRSIGVVSLFHASPTYSSISALVNNRTAKFRSTGDPWRHTWTNNEDPYAGVASSTANQAWELTSTSVYAGQVQFLTNSAPPALPVSTVLGDFRVTWEVLFRARS